MKKILVLGAGGFIGGHLVKRLKSDGNLVIGVDLKYHEYVDSPADTFIKGDLRDPLFVNDIFDQSFDEVYQLAADMGGAGFVFTGENDADIMHNSASINLNILNAVKEFNGEFLITGKGVQNQKESGTLPKSVVVKFDSYKDALSCYKCSAYEQALSFIENSSDRDFVIVEGLG